MMANPGNLTDAFQAQLDHYPQVGQSTAGERLGKLKALRKAISGPFKQEIRDALTADFGKPALETDLTEIYPVCSEIKHAEKNLRDWMRPKSVRQPLTLIGARSRIRYESKGVCLILSPWNFPLTLTLSPLVSAIAAGNCCILKPSEFAPATAGVVQRLLESLFPPEEVLLLQGDAELAASLLKLPFHHIYFTGSPRVGKIVMKAAAEHLSSVTLELGGKSPAYVGRTASLKTTARRIAWGKCTNAGQICVAPDYLLVDKTVEKDLIAALKDVLGSFYPNGAAQSDSFARIINEKHHQRLVNGLDEGLGEGGEILYGGSHSADDQFLEPTLVGKLPEDSQLLREEIFGPILPIIPVSGPEEALEWIDRRERPLAVYVYSRDKKEIRKILQGTRAGSSGINHNVVHYSNPHLPFGGINNSGIGKSHGYEGFLAFSNARSELRQYTFSSMELLLPPYTRMKKRMAKFTLRWL